MADANLQQTSHTWKQIAQVWEQQFTVPSRPSAAEVAKYLGWTKSVTQPKTKGLVLGATPELRDVLFECGIQVHAIDLNLEMLLGMTELLQHANPNEVLIKSNWLTSPLESEYFDIVLGDAVFPNIPWETRVRFFSEIKRWLKPGGHFINRAFFVPEQKPYESVQALVEHYENCEVSYQTATELIFDLHILTYDPVDHLGSMPKVKPVLEPLQTNGRFAVKSDSLQEVLGIIWNEWLQTAGDKVWVYPYRHEEEAEYQNYFKIVDSSIAPDHVHGALTPMYLLKKD